MMRHDRMDDILGAPLRRVTTGAVAGTRVPAGHDQLVKRRPVALPAHRRVMRRGFGAACNVMRIVTLRAAECAFALQKTGGLPKPIGGSGDLELIVVACA